MYAEKFKVFIIKHCKRKASEHNTSLSKIALRFQIRPEEVLYATMKDYTKIEDHTIEYILNFRFGLDVLNYKEKVPPFIYMALNNICMAYEIPPDEISALACPDDNAEDVLVHIYHGTDKWIVAMTLAELIGAAMGQLNLEEEETSEETEQQTQ